MTDLILLREKVLLFAEDDKTIRDETSIVLSLIFKKVITAKDGEEAYEKYIDEQPDMILTDIKMPQKDGLELIEDIRKNDLNTPIILFSAYSDQKYLLKAINLNVDGYIIKPINLEKVMEVFSKSAKKFKDKGKSVVNFISGAVYNCSTNSIFFEEKSSSLAQKEYILLNLLLSNYPNITSKDEIIQRIWSNEEISDSAIKNIIARIRVKIGHESIVAVSGVGWRLVLI